METIRDKIDTAVKFLNLPVGHFRSLPDSEARQIFQQALDQFVGGDDRRWWWEAFTGDAISRQVKDGWRLLTSLVPEPDQPVWFIAEDDQLAFYPVYEVTPRAAVQVIGECVGFEYYLIAKDMSWILCENHHDFLIAVGVPVKSLLEQLSP